MRTRTQRGRLARRGAALCAKRGPLLLALVATLPAAIHGASVLDTLRAISDTGIVAGLVAALAPEIGNMTSGTFLAPTDEAMTAFATRLGLASVAELRNQDVSVRRLLRYHTLVQSVNIAALPANGSTAEYATMLGPVGTYASLSISRTNGSDTDASLAELRGRANGLAPARAVDPDIAAGSAFVTVVDRVLQFWFDDIMQAIAATPALSTYHRLALACGADQQLRVPAGLTVLAPTNQAFIAAGATLGLDDAALSGPQLSVLLLHHVMAAPAAAGAGVAAGAVAALAAAEIGVALGGRSVLPLQGGPFQLSFAEGPSAAVTVRSTGGNPAALLLGPGADIPVGFGPDAYIQQVDQLLVPAHPSAAALIAATPSLSQLAAALEREGAIRTQMSNPLLRALVKVLGPEGIAGASVGLLRQILSLHVMTGQALRQTELADGSSLNTLSGAKTLTVNVDGPRTTLVSASGSRAAIVSPDRGVMYDRSFVHVINAVLLPEGFVGPVGASPAPASSNSPGSALPARPPLWGWALAAAVAVALASALLG
ncbi:hypothetical protein HYH03_012533 [Edaphochlamys debaryana]|uniref:FAS1 domain-containing protein n=1 Tax=Edaphochlamys debaryana TaxID=47281 RepID=A0A835XTU8_9CHLO|nr:hypothetical protein HYH03_012533 [Edaphochlamys debaryana]|eukprot:KAG2488903.1 hypothetical protein HYH03_012533 [Edaphochlamys debaryana]